MEDKTEWLIAIGATMWLLQLVLGLWQFRRFGRRMRELRRLGRVACGKARGRLKAGAVAMIVLDGAVIRRVDIMQGRTVFAGFRTLPELVGWRIQSLTDAKLAELGYDRQARRALLDAQVNFVTYEKEHANVQPEAVTDGWMTQN